jgi:hypothetical protein
LKENNYLGKGQVALVAHHNFNICFTATSFKNEGKRLKDYNNSADMDNC